MVPLQSVKDLLRRYMLEHAGTDPARLAGDLRQAYDFLAAEAHRRGISVDEAVAHYRATLVKLERPG